MSTTATRPETIRDLRRLDLTQRIVAGIAALATLASLATFADAQPARRNVRFWAETGPSYDLSTHHPHSHRRGGYALGGGIELGRAVSFTINAGFEHYPFVREPYPVIDYSLEPNALRAEGGSGKTVAAFSIGARVRLPGERVEPFIDVGIGEASFAYREPSYVDPATGAIVWRGSRVHDSGTLAELGLGVRSRRSHGLDWTAGIRWRTYVRLFEGPSGSSLQARVGIATR